MSNVTIEPTLETPESEDHAVRLWRREQFDQLGFDPVDARLLAASPADLGEARRLHRAGCPLDLALQILV
jgi:hypothetical protein